MPDAIASSRLDRATPALSDAELHLDAILRVCTSLTAPKPLEELLDNLLTETRSVIPADAATLYLVDGETLVLVCRQDAKSPTESRPAVLSFDRLGRVSADQRGPDGEPSAFRTPLFNDPVAQYVARTGQTINITDVHEPTGNTPDELREVLPASVAMATVSLLAAPMIDRNAKTVGVIELVNRHAGDSEIVPFTSRDEQTLTSLAAVAAVSVRNARLREQLNHSHLDTILRLASAAEFRDGDTGDHIRRMSLYSEAVARKLGRSPEWCRCILFASPMHDVGKLGIPDSILKKPGPLTPDERRIMQEHTVMGGRLLTGADNEILRMAERIAIGHHERWDGNGYPHKQRGTDIAEEARIVAIADVFDALTNARVYKPAFSFGEAMKLVSAESGRHFDPVVLDAFLGTREEIEAIYDAYRPA